MKEGSILIDNFVSESGTELSNLVLTYELSGLELGTAPIVLVNHALTGNSHVAGPDGWWADLIGPSKAIPVEKYTVLCFDIPGNCFKSEPLTSPNILNLRDVAKVFLLGIERLGIKKLKAIIGASMGGALVWQLAYLSPNLSEIIIPIACDFIARDWLLAQTEIQKILLNGSENPLHSARIHGMLCYRTPESINKRFNGERTEQGEHKVVDWLHFHGRRLQERFSRNAYDTMTHLTETIHVADNADELRSIKSRILIISIDSDLLFPHSFAIDTAATLGADIQTIFSIHGHDAFLMEYEQLSSIISPVFNE